MRIFEFLIPIAAFVATAYTITTVVRLLVQWRVAARGPGVDAGALEERLARIEGAVEGLSVETQRLTEGHRFFTQLLVRRSAPAVGGGTADQGASAADGRNGSR